MRQQKHPFETFRSDSDRVEEWRAVLRMPITQIVLGLLRDNGPEFVKAPYGLTDIDIARRYGDVGGYARHHQDLEDMAEPWPIRNVPLEETYQEEKPDA